MNIDFAQWLLLAPGIIIGLTIHEYSHAAAARWLGDDTAARMGRLTLNPLAHLDILGLLMLFLAGFGWAKPVPVNPNKFSIDRRWGSLLVSLAGPASNLFLAFTGYLVLYLSFHPLRLTTEQSMISIVYGLIHINVILAAFNLIPLPPLDGSRILAIIFPVRYHAFIMEIERYAPVIFILLIISGVLGRIIRPVAAVLNEVVALPAGLLSRLLMS